jgi:hypothetical protein
VSKSLTIRPHHHKPKARQQRRLRPRWRTTNVDGTCPWLVPPSPRLASEFAAAGQFLSVPRPSPFHGHDRTTRVVMLGHA